MGGAYIEMKFLAGSSVQDAISVALDFAEKWFIGVMINCNGWEKIIYSRNNADDLYDEYNAYCSSLPYSDKAV